MENFQEVISKVSVDYHIFQNYFFQNKNEYVIHNSIKISNHLFCVPGLGLINLLFDYKIRLIEEKNNDEIILLRVDEESKKELESLIKFYRNDISKNNLTLLSLTYIIIVKEIYKFYSDFSTYFNQIVSY
jgi:hypothetical protein